MLDERGKIIDVNQTGLTMIARPREQVLGKNFAEFVDPEDRGHFSLHLYEITKGTEGSGCELSLVTKDGRRHPVELRSNASLDDQTERVTGCFLVAFDVSTRRNLERELRDQLSKRERRRSREQADLKRSGNLLQKEVFSHEQTEAILAQTSALFEKVFSTPYLAIACLDQDLNYVRVNPAYAQAHGKSPRFFLDKPYFDLHPNDDLRSSFELVLTTGEPYVAFAVPFLMMADDKETMTWWDWNVSTLVGRTGQPRGLLVCLVDVSSRVKLEREIVHVTDQEQKRLGQELHDGMGQLLTAISIKSKILEEIIAEKTPDMVPHVEEIREMLREATVQMRDVSKLLNPRIVVTQGLGAALKSLAEETQRHLGVLCDFTWDEAVGRFDSVAAGHLYRIAQEAVTNALRHAQAREIRIALVREAGNRVLRITNDGTLFDPDKAEDSDGLGLRGMRYRAEMIGASCDITPGLNAGAVVRCVLSDPQVALDVSDTVD